MINKIYFTSREVSEALGISIQGLHKMAERIKLPRRGSKGRRKFNDTDIMKLKNEQ
jgi:DNA-binding transcriptional MerR regulator